MIDYFSEFFGWFLGTGIILFITFVLINFIGSLKDFFRYRVPRD